MCEPELAGKKTFPKHLKQVSGICVFQLSGGGGGGGPFVSSLLEDPTILGSLLGLSAHGNSEIPL